MWHISSKNALRVGFGREVAALPAPIGPAAGQPPEHLPRIGLLAELVPAVGRDALQPMRHARLGTCSLFCGTPALRKYFLRKNIDRDLRPLLWREHVIQFEDD